MGNISAIILRQVVEQAPEVEEFETLNAKDKTRMNSIGNRKNREDL